MPLIATRGAASAQGFGEFAQVTPANYIEEVFSTYLWTGNDSSQTITNGIDLSTKGGLVWIKSRAAYGHILSDTNRGTGKFLSSNTTDAQGTDAQDVTAFNTTGFTVGNNSRVNNSSFTYASWTFREQPKFFDVVTYTGNGTAGRTVAHNLGSVPGCMIIKPTSTSGEWRVWHRGLAAPATSFLYLNRTDAEVTGSTIWDSTNPTATEFTVSGSASNNGNGTQYVAYLFAHNAGGFGLTGTDNVISCGSFTTDGSGNATVSLGYEPQWILTKRSISPGGNWLLIDTMRGLSQTGTANLFPNTSGAETTTAPGSFKVTATGFGVTADAQVGGSDTWIYIAIRRGPMKVPTTGTSVYNAIARTGTGAATTVTGIGFTPDLAITGSRSNTENARAWFDRLRGAAIFLQSSYTSAEITDTGTLSGFDVMNGILVGNGGANAVINNSGLAFINWFFKRAPSFFDEVCWTGTSADQTLTHNLTVAPELIIYKARATTSNWYTACAFTSSNYSNLQLNLTTASSTVAYSGGGPFSAQPTSTQFSVGQFYNTSTMVAYLFATCAGVSKVGSYTGTGTTQVINCGFTAGARWIMIKRTDSTGDWYVWDSTRGIIAGNDPYLLMNSANAEVTGTDYVDTANSGFELSSTAPAALNANGGTYIFLAIA